MNRIVLLGNGFDLAHNRKTSYNDFMLWYLKQAFTKANQESRYEDPLLKIIKGRGDNVPFGNIKNIDQLIEHFYQQGFSALLHKGTQFLPGGSYSFENPFTVQLKSKLVTTLLNNCSFTNWVEIENEYYRELKNILHKNAKDKSEQLIQLNTTLRVIIDHLETYLSQLEEPAYDQRYKDILLSKFDQPIISHKRRMRFDQPQTTLILNFNYTSTIVQYLNKPNIHSQLNYIHGKIGDPKLRMIFGFGDEIDKDYQQIEDEQNNHYFSFIKSFWYTLNTNYRDLMRFIEAEEYEIYILGHSCGLSDRTMLNELFEHNNCKSIKIYFYEKDEHKDNFTELTHEISRHFKDKSAMRKKIISKEKSSPMPQLSRKN